MSKLRADVGADWDFVSCSHSAEKMLSPLIIDVVTQCAQF